MNKFFIFDYIYLVHTNSQVSCSLTCITSRHLMLSHKRRLYLHHIINYMGSIFLPPLACGFTLPQGDSRWGSSISYTRLRTFPAKHPLYKPLAQTFSMCHAKPIIDTDLFLFQHRSSHSFF